MANKKTLKPQAHVLTVEEQSKGGKASVEARRERKQLKEALEAALALPNHTQDGKEQTNIEGICAALVQKALEGDVRAFTVIRDTIGEMPVPRLEVTQQTLFEHDQAKFNELLEQLEAGE